MHLLLNSFIKGEVQEALSTRLNFDNNFVRCMLDMVYSVCRDLNQLSYIVRISFLTLIETACFCCFRYGNKKKLVDFLKIFACLD